MDFRQCNTKFVIIFSYENKNKWLYTNKYRKLLFLYFISVKFQSLWKLVKIIKCCFLIWILFDCCNSVENNRRDFKFLPYTYSFLQFVDAVYYSRYFGFLLLLKTIFNFQVFYFFGLCIFFMSVLGSNCYWNWLIIVNDRNEFNRCKSIQY